MSSRRYHLDHAVTAHQERAVQAVTNFLPLERISTPNFDKRIEHGRRDSASPVGAFETLVSSLRPIPIIFFALRPLDLFILEDRRISIEEQLHVVVELKSRAGYHGGGAKGDGYFDRGP